MPTESRLPPIFVILACFVAQELGMALCPVMLPQPTGAQVDTGGRKRHKVEVVLRSKNRGEMVGGVRTLVH